MKAALILIKGKREWKQIKGPHAAVELGKNNEDKNILTLSVRTRGIIMIHKKYKDDHNCFILKIL